MGAELDALLPVEESLAQLSMFTGQDCSDWELDAPVPELPPLAEFAGPQGRYETILRIISKDSPTVRELLGTLAAGGGHCTMLGTPESIADEIERWYRAGAADDIRAARQAGLWGVALGATEADGRLDRAALGPLIAAAGGMAVTIHRRSRSLITGSSILTS